MPTINLTNDTTLSLTASSAAGNNTLLNYLQQNLDLKAPDGFETTAAETVAATDATAFPIQLSATGEGKFAAGGTTLDVQAGVSAPLGLLKGNDVKSVLSSVGITESAITNLVSVALTGTVSVADTAKESDFTFGITDKSSFTLTAYTAAADADTMGDAIERTLGALTIPHGLADIKGLPANAICQLDASGSLKFSASVSYNFLNNPLATVPIPALPAVAIKAGGSVTLEASVTHTSDHTLTIAKLPTGAIRIAVSVTGTNDFETSLSASAGITANIGGNDALGYLLGLISPASDAEIAQLKQDLPADQAASLSSGIKAAIDGAVSNSLQLSLKAALDNSASHNTVFVYEIDPAALDAVSTAAVEAALTGDFTALTKSGAALAGVKELMSTVTDTTKITHSLAIHLLGIFNEDSINTFMKKATVSSVNGNQLVLSDTSVDVTLNNLDADKLRQVISKGVTLTLPAVAASGAGATMSLVFFDRQASTKPGHMREFVNTLRAVGPSAATDQANALFAQNPGNYGACSVFLGLSLTAAQCAQLFARGADPMTYILEYCSDMTTILNGDPDSVNRLTLFNADQNTWTALQKAGSAQNIVTVLKRIGIPQSAPPEALVPDVLTGLMWSSAMANFSKAVAAAQPVDKVGAQFVKAGTLGFGEPWMILAVWNMVGNPVINVQFTSSLVKTALAAAKGA